MSEQVEDYGPTQARAVPPLDATATVAVNGDEVTEADVDDGSTLRLHIAERDESSLPHYEGADGDTGGATGDEAEDANLSVEARSPSWLTVTVDYERVCRVGVAPEAVATVDLEPRGDT